MKQVVFFLVSLAASTAGAICGIGGGIVIKPTLDLMHLASVSTISFLSSCTVLSMTCYSVGKGILKHDSAVDMKTGTPLGIGAAVGGIAGQKMFAAVKAMFNQPNVVGAVQAASLFAITLATLIYTVRKEKIHTFQFSNKLVCILIGLALGISSSFMGIGGGPINLMVLGYFFSMKSKAAAQNSLYIILFSQITNLITTIASGNIPPFDAWTLILMVMGGVGGGMIGRKLNQKMNHRDVDRLFIMLMGLILCICLYNTYRYGWA